MTSPTSDTLNVSSAGRGLLTSNRLHGPRQMSNGSLTKDDSAAGELTVRDKRKTVTFEEEPEVQEFDRESSFDGNSLRSADSNPVLKMRPESSNLTQGDGDGDGNGDIDNEALIQQAYWNSQRQHLMVVNGSPSDEFPSPAASDQDRITRDIDCNSISSPDLSSVDTEASELEPASPERTHMSLHRSENGSFDKTWAMAANETAEPGEADKDASFVSLGGLNRVDSMVDELLQADILTSPPISPQNTGASEQIQTQGRPTWSSSPDATRTHALLGLRHYSPEIEMPVRRGADKSKPAPRLSAHLRDASPDRKADEAAIERHLLDSEINETGKRGLQSSALPNLPNWSPLMIESKPLPDLDDKIPQPALPQAQRADILSSPRRPGGRPHISRDAVLERVAKEKRAQAEAEARQRQQNEAAAKSDTSLPSVYTAVELAGKCRPLAPAIRPGITLTALRVLKRPTGGVEHKSESESYETRPQPTPSPIENQAIEGASPLERLGEQVAAAAHPSSSDAAAMQATPKSPWLNPVQSLPKTSDRSEPATQDTPSGYLVLPPASLGLPGPPSPPLGTRSVLGPVPPAITPEQYAEQIIARRRSKNKGRRKRSVSTGDAGSTEARRAHAAASQQDVGSNKAEDLGSPSIAEDEEADEQLSDRASIQADLNQSKLMLDTTVQKALDNGFSNGLCRDISRIFRDSDSPYKVNDRGAFEGVQEKVSHSRQAGDVDAGKAWRKLRRPSDISEYADEMRAYRANENPKRSAGKVFVMVDSFQPANLPIPAVPSKFFCILDNGLHVVKTGLSSLSSAVSPIAQEFELIQHKNLEFSLTLFVHKETPISVTPTKKEKTGSITKSFVSRLLRSPKKDKTFGLHPTEQVDPLAAYTNREGAFGRVDLVFESVAAQCLGKCLVIDLPVRGVSDPASTISGHSSINSRRHADFSRNLSRTRGTLRLKLFYLPPMPSVPKKLAPENLRECVVGMENAKWHLGEPQMSGILTQQGGDCRTWRRRPVQAQGTFLICFNDVTKRPIVKIDLSKAKSIDENWDPYDPALVKHDGQLEGGRMVSKQCMVKRFNANEEPDESYHVPNSFRLTFADGEVISFFADTEEERKQWITVMQEMIHTRRPPNPMWAQVAWEIICNIENGQQRPLSQQANRRQQPVSRNATSTAPSGAGQRKSHVGTTIPPIVEEVSDTVRSQRTRPQGTPASPVAVRRKQLPSIFSKIGSDGVEGERPSSAPSSARTALPAHQSQLPSASLSNPWATPKQRQCFASPRPNMAARPQSELFTPVRKQSTVQPIRQRT